MSRTRMCRKMKTIACIGSNRFVPIARYTDRCTSDNTKRSLRLHNSTNVGSGVLVQDQSDRGEWSVPRLKSTFPARKAESLLGLIVSSLSSGIDADGIFSAAAPSAEVLVSPGALDLIAAPPAGTGSIPLTTRSWAVARPGFANFSAGAGTQFAKGIAYDVAHRRYGSPLMHLS
jgi:hypothetical protein